MCSKVELNAEHPSNGLGAADRPGDPLFPILPSVLEALRARAASKRAAGAEEKIERDEFAMLLESICGANDDSQPVEQYNGALGVTTAFVSAHQAAVGQIQWNDNLASIYTNPGTVNGARWCSGTLIANDLFLTAGHCFDQTGGGWERPRVNGTSNVISPNEIATNMHVNFNFQVDPAGVPRTESRFAITALLEYRINGLDFAVVRLAGNPGATFGRASIATTDATAGQMLCIIGHPAGLPKRIEAGPALAPQGDLIRYDDIDTLGGNSGSGVLRASDGRIVGVHTNGGCVSTSPNGVNANFGQRIVSLINASPTLQSLTRPTKLKFVDDPVTIKATDDSVTLKFIDDLGTSLAADIGSTLISADMGPSLKFRDDNKQPALDKPPIADVKLPGLDGVVDPGTIVINPGIGNARPFVLSTPHHSMAWTSVMGEQAPAQHLASYEAALQQLSEMITQHRAALLALDAEFQRVAGQYEAAKRQP